MVVQVECFKLRASPLVLSQKLEARTNGGVEHETTDFDSRGQVRPASAFHEVFEDRFQRDAMKGVVGLFLTHDAPIVMLTIGETES